MPDAWVTKNPMKLFRLDGKVAIVTGSASGIGQASAMTFGRGILVMRRTARNHRDHQSRTTSPYYLQGRPVRDSHA